MKNSEECFGRKTRKIEKKKERKKAKEKKSKREKKACFRGKGVLPSPRGFNAI